MHRPSAFPLLRCPSRAAVSPGPSNQKLRCPAHLALLRHYFPGAQVPPAQYRMRQSLKIQGRDGRLRVSNSDNLPPPKHGERPRRTARRWPCPLAPPGVKACWSKPGQTRRARGRHGRLCTTASVIAIAATSIGGGTNLYAGLRAGGAGAGAHTVSWQRARGSRAQQAALIPYLARETKASAVQLPRRAACVPAPQRSQPPAPENGLQVAREGAEEGVQRIQPRRVRDALRQVRQRVVQERELDHAHCG